MARINPVFKSPLFSNHNRPTTNLFSPSSQLKKPKSISIPVTFVHSKKIVKNVDPSSAAIKIQKFFRGFLVRKNLKTVRKIEEDVNEIELKLKRSEEMDRIVRDEKERIKIGEMLMRFLFRLDSVRGVRDYRKKVIKRIISIQEMLDSIANKNIKPEVEEIKSVITEEINACDNQVNAMNEIENTVESLDQNEKTELAEAVILLENNNAMDESKNINAVDESKNINAVDESKNINAVDEDMKMKDSSEATEADENDGDNEKQSVIAEDVNACDKQVHVPNETRNVVESMDQNAETIEVVNMDESKNLYVVDEDLKMLASSEATESNENQNERQNMENDKMIVENETVKRKIGNEDGELEMKDENECEKRMEDDNDNKQKMEDENEKLKIENDKMKNIMESMMVENEKLKGLVVELCARSVQQCKLMGGIAERVENLEKAVKKMKKKDKKRK